MCTRKRVTNKGKGAGKVIFTAPSFYAWRLPHETSRIFCIFHYVWGLLQLPPLTILNLLD